MLHKPLPVALTLLGLAAMAAASTDEPWYIGGKAGQSDFRSIRFGDAVANPRNLDKSGAGAGVFMGYQLNEWLALEGGYDYLGKIKFDSDVNEQHALRVQGIQLAARLGMPLSDTLDVYTRLGVMASRISGGGAHAHHTAPMAALGAEYALGRHWYSRLEYQWVSRVGTRDADSLRAHNGHVAVGLLYKFGGTAPLPAPLAVAMPAPPPEPLPAPAAPPPVAEPRAFTLQSDMLFDFNKASLRPAGDQALMTLIQQIRDEQTRDASITVEGHSDRLGSPAYNLGLSRQRAQTVADFLVRNGMPRHQVSVEAAGETAPVTGSQCDAIKARAALIHCLAADRRVVVLVRGNRPAP